MKRPFLSCFELHYERKSKAFQMKISFYMNALRMKDYIEENLRFSQLSTQ